MSAPTPRDDRRDATTDRRATNRGGRRLDDAYASITPRELLDLARTEELIAIELLARAFKTTRRKVLRDWESRQHPVTSIGRTIYFSSALVIQSYFPHAVSGRSMPLASKQSTSSIRA